MRETDIKELLTDKILYETDPETRAKYESYLQTLHFSSDRDYQEFLEIAQVVDLDNYNVK
jgi:hypothetical protein